MKRWIAALPLVVLAFGVVLFAAYALNKETAQVSPDALVGRPVPALRLAPLEGGAVQVLGAPATGKPYFVNIFASWCVPCAVEHPQLMWLRDKGAVIIGVAYKDEPARSADFLARLGDPFVQVLVDRDGRAGIDLGIAGVPETYLVGADGRILAKHTGPMMRVDAERLLTRAR